MSARESKRSRLFKMSFPQKLVSEPIMHRISSEFKVIPNIIRGRITEKGATLDVRLTGSPKSLADALAYLADQGVGVTPLAD
ncbi:MAG TPA: NIL domain-containing protein [Planctomycetota bacterium]